MMNILACASDNYTMQCGILFCSVCENNQDEKIDFYVFTDNKFKEESKDKLRKTIGGYHQKTIHFVCINDADIDNVLQFETPLYTRHVFYRLLMAELLPESVNKVLYLDCDIVVRHSLLGLWNTELSDKAVAVVHDGQEGKMSQFNRLGYSYDKGYFNSGVMLANLEYWRKTNATKRLFNYIERNADKIYLPDQDPLNVIFQDEKTFIHFKYNLQSDFLLKTNYLLVDYSKYKTELSECVENPVVLHFSGARPWIEGCVHPYKDEFFYYRSKTLWKNEPLWKDRKPFKTRLLSSNLLRKPLSKLGLCSVLEDRFNRELKLVGYDI